MFVNRAFQTVEVEAMVFVFLLIVSLILQRVRQQYYPIRVVRFLTNNHFVHGNGSFTVMLLLFYAAEIRQAE